MKVYLEDIRKDFWNFFLDLLLSNLESHLKSHPDSHVQIHLEIIHCYAEQNLKNNQNFSLGSPPCYTDAYSLAESNTRNYSNIIHVRFDCR
jgi:hypothetical protein